MNAVHLYPGRSDAEGISFLPTFPRACRGIQVFNWSETRTVLRLSSFIRVPPAAMLAQSLCQLPAHHEVGQLGPQQSPATALLVDDASTNRSERVQSFSRLAAY